MKNTRQAALAAALLVVLSVASGWPLGAAAQADRIPVTEEEGRRIAAAALRYAEVRPGGLPSSEPGMPYLWGGRTTVDELLRHSGVAGSPAQIGVDASGLVVNALRTVLGPDLRFLASAGDAQVTLADATSHLLYHHNVQIVEPQEARPGDLLFFGRDGDITGVAVVVERQGDRIDFVVASARAGRVIRTFVRIGGEYWDSAVVGLGRFLKPTA